MSRAAARRQTGGQAARFLVVGLCAAGIDYAMVRLGIALGASPYLARALALMISMVAAWLGNRYYTFRTPGAANFAEFGRYAMTAAMGAAINYAIFAAMLQLGTGVEIAFVVAAGLSAIFNFVRQRRLLAKN